MRICSSPATTVSSIAAVPSSRISQGMSEPQVALQGPRNDIFEGGMTYKIKRTNQYLTLVEAIGPARYYRAWIADRLDGEWKPLPDATTFAKPFAGINNVTLPTAPRRGRATSVTANSSATVM